MAKDVELGLDRTLGVLTKADTIEEVRFAPLLML